MAKMNGKLWFRLPRPEVRAKIVLVEAGSRFGTPRWKSRQKTLIFI